MTHTERLLAVAKDLLHPRSELFVADERFTDTHFARARIALDFHRRKPAFKLRALFEE